MKKLTEDFFLRLPQVLELIPISKSAWWQGCKEGRFPKPIKLGPRTSAWRSSDIRAAFPAIRSGGKNRGTEII